METWKGPIKDHHLLSFVLVNDGLYPKKVLTGPLKDFEFEKCEKLREPMYLWKSDGSVSLSDGKIILSIFDRGIRHEIIRRSLLIVSEANDRNALKDLIKTWQNVFFTL